MARFAGAQPVTVPEEAELVSAGLPAPLRGYQWAGVSFLTEASAGLLADEMGLGKTVQAAVALRVLFARRQVGRALIVAPASLRLNWQRELLRWAPELAVRTVRGSAVDRQAVLRLPLPIVVVSYEHLRADIQAVRRFVNFDVVILDEAQRIKNADSSTALACRLIPRARSWALTGTPLENRVTDLQSVLRFVRPDLNTAGFTRNELHDALRHHFLRRKKEDVLPDLPPIVVQDLPLELEGRQRSAYDDIWFSREEYAVGASEVQLLALITRLKQVCNHDLDSGESVKFEAISLILDSLSQPNDKLLIFSQYVESLKWLSNRISPFPHEIYHGGLSEDQRDAVLTRFNDEAGPRVLLMSLRAGGVGLNLQAASAVVLFDRWWNPAVEHQAIARAHRFGRERPLHVYRLLVTDTIEERIAEVLEEKEALFEEYVEEAESKVVRLLARSELLLILDLPRQKPEIEPELIFKEVE